MQSRSDLHPNGREFVFDTLGELYCLPIEGGQAKRILAGVEWDVDPRFSADGTQLLYVSDAGQGAQKYVFALSQQQSSHSLMAVCG